MRRTRRRTGDSGNPPGRPQRVERKRSPALNGGVVARVLVLVCVGLTCAGLGLIATAGAGVDAAPEPRPWLPPELPGSDVETNIVSTPTADPLARDGAVRIYIAELRALLTQHAPAYAQELELIGVCESGRWDAETESWYVRPGAVGDDGDSLGWLQIWRGWPARLGLKLDPFDPVDAIHLAVAIREARGRFGDDGGWTCAGLVGVS